MKQLIFLLAIVIFSCKDGKKITLIEANIDHIADSTLQISFKYDGKDMYGSLPMNEVEFKTLYSGKVNIYVDNSNPNEIKYSSQNNSVETKKIKGPITLYAARSYNKPSNDTFPPIHVKLHILNKLGDYYVIPNSDGFTLSPVVTTISDGATMSTGINIQKGKQSTMRVFHLWEAKNENSRLIQKMVCDNSYNSFLTKMIDSFPDTQIYTHYSDTLAIPEDIGRGTPADSFFMVSAISLNGSHKHYNTRPMINSTLNNTKHN
jgi:hypothetical protein